MKISHNVAELQREHVVFELECIDRMYLNAYIPRLTNENGSAWFFRGHMGRRFASTKDASPMTDRFVAAIGQFQGEHDLELARFYKPSFPSPRCGIAARADAASSRKSSARTSIWADLNRCS